MEKKWEIRCSPETFSTVRYSDQFKKVLTLARILNSLIYALGSLPFDKDESDTPHGERQVVGSFMYLGALLHEALLYSETLRKTFHHGTCYEQGLGAILRDPEVRTLRNGILKTLRNKMVFHFDHDVIHASVEAHGGNVVFARGIGSHNGAVYFPFAAETTMDILMNTPSTEEEFKIQFTKFIEDMTALSSRYIQSANELIGEVITRLGFEYHEA